MEAAEGLRRRVVPEQGNSQVLEPAQGEQAPPGIQEVQNNPPDNAHQIKVVAEAMFNTMCTGLGKEVISEDDMENAMQNLSDEYLSPTKSLMRTQEYALSSQNMTSYVKRLLQDVIKYSESKEVRIQLM